MCGIAGIVGKQTEDRFFHSAIKKMNDVMSHRGPDADGFWNDEECFLSHRRLSIIDLSESGNQPFISNDGRYIMIYNGELYNFRELKLELQRAEFGSKELPYIFKTHSDTEVILAAYIRWGADCLNRFNGMFAFAIWDTFEKKLFVARDRIGEKPLYYSIQKNVLLFASEIRALIYSGLIDKKINLESISEYIQYATVHAPNTILENVYVLMPGCFFEFKNNVLNIKKYWDISNYTKSSEKLTYQETCKNIKHLLINSVQKRLISDVPFGAFLSGGIDSSAIVGLMSQVSSEKVQTFNVSFDESEFSESIYAKQVAKRFNTQHHEIKLIPKDFLKQLPEALNSMDYPSGDGPNSYVVSKATKKAGITVALSGLGGDELFAGYDIFKRYYELEKKNWLNIIPGKGLIGKLLAAKKNSIQGDKMAEILNLEMINGFNAYPINRKLFNQKDYQKLITEYYNPDYFIKNIIKESTTDKNHTLSKVSLFEIQTYMQNVLLRDTDQMSMSVALEVRVPFLDHKLVEFILTIDDKYKYPHYAKKLLIDSLDDLLPNNIINRPKMGFVLPWKNWLKEDLKDFCEENITQFSKRPFVNRESVLILWNRFLNNDPKITWSRIWHLVVLNYWINTHQIEC